MDNSASAIKKRREESLMKSGGASVPSSSTLGTGAMDIKQRRMASRYGFDTLQNDESVARNLIRSSYGGWQDAGTLAQNRQTIQGVADRLQGYAKVNPKAQGLSDYYQQALGSWDDMTALYGQYQNADAYTKAKNQQEYKDKYKGASRSAVVKALQTAQGDERDYLSNFTDYSSAQDFEQAIASAYAKDSGASREYIKRLKGAYEAYATDHAFDEYASLVPEATSRGYDISKNPFTMTASDWLGDMNNVSQQTYKMLNDEERAVAQYINETQGREAADKYLKKMLGYASKRDYEAKRDETQKKIDEGGFWTNVGLTAKNLLTSAAMLPTATVESVEGILGGEYTPYGGASGAYNLAQDSSGMISKEIADFTDGAEILGRNVPAFLYDAMTSASNSAIGELALGPAFTVLMGGGAYASTYKRALERGLDSKSASSTALLSGIAESLFEYVSLDKFIKMSDSKSVKDIVVNMLKQAGVEGSEEVATEFSNAVTDYLVNGGEAEQQKNYQQYIDRGYTSKEAWKLATVDFVGELTESFLAGALSSMPTTAFHSTMDYNTSAKAGNIRDLESYENTLREIDEQYGALGDSSRVSQFRDLMKAYDGKFETKSDKAALGNQLRHSMEGVDEAGKAKILGNVKSAREVKKSEALDKQARKDFKIGEKSEVKIADVETTDDGTVLVIDEKGESHSAKDVTLTKSDAHIAEFASIMNDDAKKKAFLDNYTGQDAEAYHSAFNYLYTRGLMQSGEVTAVRDVPSSIIDEATATRIYMAGFESSAMIHETEAKKSEAVLQTASKNYKPGAFSYDKNTINVKKLRGTEKTLYNLARFYSSLGLNISLIKDESDTSSNGHYDRESNTITINLAARYTKATESSRKYVLATMSHEFTHFIRKNDEAGYNVIKDALMKAFGETGWDNIVAKEYASLTQYADKSQRIDVAIEEAVARSCEDMLSDEKTMEEVLAKLNLQELNTFKDAIEKFFKDLKGLYVKFLDAIKSDANASKKLREDMEAFEEVRKKWASAFAVAIANAQDVETQDVSTNEDKADSLSSKKIDVEPISEATYQEIVDHFGTTNNMNTAGYMLADGKVLDFSGKHWGATSSTYRQVDHRDIAEVLEDTHFNNGAGSMITMIGNGNIRLMPETGGINLAKMPTEAQFSRLAQYIRYHLSHGDREINVDFDEVGGDTVYSLHYESGSADQIIADIKDYFNNGVKSQSDVARFHTMYSKKLDKEYMTAINNRDMNLADKLVREAARRAGYTRMMFHETDARSIHVFDISMGTHGGTDSGTPYGIFTKSSSNSIGLGRYQMSLYVKAKNVLTVADRDDVRKVIPEFVPYYDKIKQIDSHYGPLIEELTDRELDLWDRWHDKHPDIDVDEVYPTQYIIDDMPANIDDPEYLEVFQRRKALNEEWKDEYDKVAIRSKEFLTKYLRDHGYDAMYFALDGGSGGRQTDSLILLDQDQVKDASTITYDDNWNIIPLSERFQAGNPDIRYSKRLDSTGITLTDAQVDFFWDSVVRDDQGRLLRMYHGTPMGGYTVFKNGTYFSADKDYASKYQSASASSTSSPRVMEAKQSANTPQVYEVYLNITKPFDTRNAKEQEIFEKYRLEEGGTVLQESGLPDWTDGVDLSDWLQDNGYDYDGLILDEGGYLDENGDVVDRGLSYVPFNDASQIKSVDNQNPTSDPDIRYSKRVDEYAEPITEETASDVYELLYSKKVTDADKLKALDEQEYITTYKAFQLVDGKLYSPMALLIDGKPEEAYELGQWMEAVEHPELITWKNGKAYFVLKKGVDANGKKLSDVPARYNPYEHSSNLMINDQFSTAYKRPNLVVCEVRIPKSEVTSEYHAENAHQSTGWNPWTKGAVASKLARAGKERKVMLSRWAMPVRIVPDSEVAQHYKELLEGTGIGVPSNVVTPSLLKELKKLGVKIEASSEVEGINEIHETEESETMHKVDESVYEIVGEDERLKAENEKLRQDLANAYELLKLQGTETGGRMLKKSQIQAAARAIIKFASDEYGIKSEITAEDLAKDITELYQYIIDHEDYTPAQGEDYVNREFTNRVYDMQMAIADKILGSSNKIEIGKDPTMIEALAYFRTKKITLTDAQIQEARYMYGEKWRNQFFGKVIISKDGANLDSIWSELCRWYPDLFSEDTNSNDMAIELLNGIMLAQETSHIYETFNRQEVLRDIADEVYNKFWSVDIMTTVADKYAKQIQKLKNQHKKTMSELRQAKNEKYEKQILADRMYYGKLIQNIRDRKANEIQQIKDFQKQRSEAAKLQAQRSAMIGKITNLSNDMMRQLIKNDIKNVVPDVLKAPLNDLLSSIDYSSKSLLNRGEETRKDRSFATALRKMSEAVNRIDKIQNGEDIAGVDLITHFDLPPAYADTLQQLADNAEALKDKYDSQTMVLQAMSLDDLTELHNALTEMKHIIRNYNKIMSAGNNASISEVADRTNAYADRLGKAKDKNKLMQFADKFMKWDMSVPYYAFKHMGEGALEMFQYVADGWEQFARNIKEISDFAEKTYDEGVATKCEKDIHTFELLDLKAENPETAPKITVKMSMAHIMSLYCLNKREQARGHIYGGGIVVKGVVVDGKDYQQAKAVALTDTEVADILSVVENDPEAKRIADALQNYMNTKGSDWGNAITMKRFGIRGFTEENYFPIKSDANVLGTEVRDNEKSIYKLLNMSFTKALTTKANNQIEIDSIFNTFTGHMGDMAKYNALALPVLDMIKWWNYKYKIKGTGTQFTAVATRTSIENAFGKDANKYIQTFLQDLNGNAERGRGEYLGKIGVRRYKMAAVGFNLQVALLQPLSYIRAGYTMDRKYLIKAMAMKPAIQKAKDKSGIALWKSMGFYDTNITRGLDEMIRRDSNVLDKTLEASMKLAEYGDSFTWGVLWNACELEVKSTTGLTQGEAFDKAVANRFRDVILQTQVVDSSISRSTLMRAPDLFTQTLTAFMSEPTIALNMLSDSVYQFGLDARESGKHIAFANNGKKLARAIECYVIASAVESALRASIDALRDEEDEDEYLELLWTHFLDEMNLLNKVPVLKDVISVIKGYSVERMDMGYIKSICQAWQGVQKAQDEGWSYKTTYKCLKAISQSTGLPVSNLMREIVTLWNISFGEMFDLEIDQ